MPRKQAAPYTDAATVPLARLPKIGRWRALLTYICQGIVGQIGPLTPPPTLAAPR
jgi:hypothetical protein